MAMTAVQVVAKQRRAASSRFARAALLGVLVFFATAAAAQPRVREVLLLQSLNRGNLTLDSFTSYFRVELDRRAAKPVNVIQVVVGPAEPVGAPDQAVVDYIRSMYRDGREPDLIVTAGGPAAVFARTHRQELFPRTPLLLASVDYRFLRDGLRPNETAVSVILDTSHLIDEILQVRPDTRQVFMIMGAGSLGRFWRRELDQDFLRFRGRVTFVWADDLSLPELMQRCANLPPHSAIVYFTFGTDSAGAAYADERVLSDLHTTANAPLFGIHSVMLGRGVVGGSLLPIEEVGRQTAQTAARILSGIPPERIRLAPIKSGKPIFDWRELERWNIDRSRLPAGSVIIERPPSLWSQHRITVLVVLGALVIQSLLIVGLVYERRARRKAEIEGRRNLAMAADAHRRETMSALTGSIAHELGQPLTSMMADASTLQILSTSDRLTPEMTQEVVSDIRSQGHRAIQILERHRKMLKSRQMEMKPIDLYAVIHESIAVVAHDARDRQVETRADFPSQGCVILGDPVLLQQVFVNLMMNAIEAMRETPPPRRLATIRSELQADQVQVWVHDSGTGLPEAILSTLFTPFLTAKPDGLGIGLTIARTIIEAHGGTITAENNPDEGATFNVTLRRIEARA
jgi:signal transduction histidine kinase